MSTKYRTKRYSLVITEVEVTRETAQCVWHTLYGREMRALRVSDSEQYHDTWAAAYEHLRKVSLSNLRKHREACTKADEDIDALERMYAERHPEAPSKKT